MKTIINGKYLITFGLILFALSYGSAKTSSVESEIHRLEMDIPSLYLINGMFFSADQTKQLAGFLTKNAKMKVQAQKDMRQFLINHQKDIDLLIDMIVAGRKEKKQSASLPGGIRFKQLHKVRHDWQILIRRNQSNPDKIARKMLETLTPAQRDILDRFVPCFVPPADFRNPERVGQADGNISRGASVLARLRQAPTARLNDAIERSLDVLVPTIMKEQHAKLTKQQINELRDELRPSLKEMTIRIRNMNKSDFELEKSKLAKEFLCLYSADDKQGGNELWKIKRYILNPGITPVITQRAGSKKSSHKKKIVSATVIEEIKQNVEAFKTANLISNLELTVGQARELLPLIRKAVNARSEIDQEAAKIFPQALAAYVELKKELENQQISQTKEKEAQKYNYQLKMLYRDKLSKTILEYRAEMDRLLSADQVAFLTGSQERTKGGRPHTKQSKNISVVRSYARELYDKTDKMKDTDFTSNSRNLCIQFIESCLSTGVINPNDIDKDAETKRIEQTLIKARKMRRSEYNKKREDLIAEICPRRNKPRPEVFRWQKSMGNQLETVDTNTRLLFSQTGQALIEKKIQFGN